MRLELVIELADMTKQASATQAILRMPEMETLIARGDALEPSARTCDASLIATFAAWVPYGCRVPLCTCRS